MTTHDHRILALIDRWESTGRSVTAADLCSDCPDLRLALERQIAFLLAAAADDAPPELPQIDGYQILERLGAGGMGVVYRAFDTATQRQVALKLIHEHLLSSGVVRNRFQREILACARLRHEDIVHVHRAGIIASGSLRSRPFLEMEFAPGRPLDEIADQHSWDLPTALRTLARAARAVAHAHREGIVHRDLKPANILVTPNATSVKVVDFGLARVLRDNISAETLDGGLVGTPYYMSPEQVRNAPHNASTDLFSLGVVLYRLTTGRLPYAAHGSPPDTGTGASAAHAVAYLSAVNDRNPTPPRSFQPAYPKDLQIIVLKALEREPGRRYHSADALADDLERFLRGEPILARPQTLPYVLTTSVRRHRAAFSLGLLAFAALIVATAVGFVSTTRQRDRALAAEALAQRNAAESREIARSGEVAIDFIGDLTLFHTYNAFSGKPLTADSLLQGTLDKAREKFASDPAALAMVLYAAGKSRMHSDLDPALRLVTEARDIRTKLYGPDHISTLDAQTMVGNGLLYSGQIVLAETILLDTVARLGNAYPGDFIKSAETLRVLSNVHLQAGRVRESQAVLRDMLQLALADTSNRSASSGYAEPSGIPDWVVRIRRNIGSLDARLGDRTAIKALEAALAKESAANSPDSLTATAIELNLASALSACGEHVRAEALFVSNLDRRQRIFGPRAATVGYTHLGLAENRTAAGHHAAAAESYLAAIDVLGASLSANSAVIIAAQTDLHASLRRAGQTDAADSVLATLQTHAQSMLADQSPLIPDSILSVASALRAADNPQAADNLIEAARAKARSLGWPPTDPRFRALQR
jgi:eukaryotic-like serine/threonine-protein kinase